MPIFEYKGKDYEVSDEHAKSFVEEYPDASIIMRRGGDEYRVKMNDYDSFISEMPAQTKDDTPDFRSYTSPQPKTEDTAAQTTVLQQQEVQRTNAQAMSAQMPAGQKQTQAKQSEPEYVEGFGEGFKQGWQGLVSGSKYLVGEVANVFSGSSEDDKNALGRWDELQKKGVDIAAATDMKKWGEDAMVNEGGTLRALTQQEKLDYETIQKAIQETDGDLDKARKLMEQRAKETTWGDSLKQEAAEEMNQMKPTKGFGAWVGNLAPQMLPSGAALALAYFTKNPKWAKMVGNIGMAGMTASTAGSTMKEARDAGASDMQVWGAGVADGTIEYLTEKLPFDKLTNRIFGTTKKKLSREIADGLADNPQTREEMERLLGEAASSVGLNWKQVGKSVLAQTTAEGLSEAAAGTLQTATQMIYQEPENYPTLYDYVTNAWEGAKAGMFMGAVLGAPVPLAQKVQNDKRRKQQGEVYVAGYINDNGETEVVEVVGSSKDGNLVVFGESGYKEISPEDVTYAHTFSYQEFKTGELEQEYDNGYNLETPQEMTDAKNMYDMQRQRVADALGDEVLADIDRDPEAAIGKLGEDEPTNRTVIEYLNAKMVYDGMNKRVADDADARIAESDALVDSHTHKKTGMVQGATMKDEDRKVYIVNGNVVPLQDGTGIDLEASDNSIIIRDAESGELEQVSPEVLLSVDAGIDPTAEKQAAREAIESEVRANAERMQNGVVGFAPGDVYSVLGEDGNTHQVEIVQDNGDNTVTAKVDGEAVEEVMTKDQIQNEVDAYNKQRVVLVAQSAEDAENAEAAKPNYELNAHVTMQTPEGVVTGNINQAENDDNLIEVQVNKPFGGKKTVDMYTREELDNMVVEVADENGNVIWSKPAENAEAAANVQGAENVNTPSEGGAENVNTAPATPIVRGKHDQIDAVESIKAGTTPQQMADAYMQEYGDEEGLPLSTAQEKLAQVQEERQKTKDVDLKNGPLRKQEKFWNEVVDLLTPKEAAPAEESRQETVGTPVALQYLLEGGKGSIENAGYFFYAIQAAFPHIGAQLQEIRNSMSAEMLGMAPDAFVSSNPSQLQEVRRLVEATYGEAGTRILDQMLANSTGFYPREGKALDLEIENLKPQENAEGVSEEEAPILQAGFIPEGERKLLTKDEISAIMDALEDAAVPKPNVEYTQAEWDARFKEPLDTPVGKVRMGGHQFGKLHPDGNAQHQDRRGWIGLIHETLTNPNVIVEQNAPEEGAERGYKYVFVKSFINSSGESVTYFASVSVKKEGMEVVITNHFKKYKDIKGILEKGKLCFSSISPSGMQTEPNQPSASATTSETGSNAGVSEGKVSESSSLEEGTAEEISENAQNATQSEQNELEKAEKERIDALVPAIEDVADDMQTADEFVAGLFGNGIRITPESFRKETGLGWEEQRRLVGIIAGKEKGGLTVEQAAETIVENYRAELAERGFSGDSMEMRDMVIDILSSGNPRAYAKEAAARRAEQALHREMEAFDRYTQEAFHMSAEEYIMYEESMLPKYIEQYKDFDEQEYYSNFADEQSTQNEHDTTRESAETGGSREILSEEQPSATPGEGTAGEGQQGGTLQGDVQGDAQEGLARAEAGQEGELASTGRLNQIREKVSLNLGDKYSLSSEQADNGELFYQGESGTTLAVIPDEIFDRMGISPVPFKLTESMGWHVYDHHKNETGFKNISDAIDFILSIINNVDHVRLGRDNSYIFSVENGRNKTGRRAVTIMINSKTGAFIGIKTSGYESIKNLKGRPLLWERGAETAPEDVASPTIATITPQQGDEDVSRTKSQSNASSGYKDTDNLQNNTNKQGVISENAGNAKSSEQTGRTRFSTSMFEDAERIAREEQRRAPLRRTARAWEKLLGVKVTLMERLEDVKDPVARREIEAAEKKGKNVPGWYSDTEGVFLYLPHVEDVTEVDKTCVHEIVSHKGLKELLGQEKFDELCRKVWGIMSPAARKKYSNYPNVHNELEAADEYIAHLSENVELTARERSVWQKIMDFIADLLGRKADNRSKAASIVGKETLSRKDIAELVRLSYAEYLQRNGREEAVKDATNSQEEINADFNKNLQKQIDGTLPKGFVYQLGMPSDVLRSVGIPNLPIEMASQRLVHKSNQENHPFDLSEVRNLPNAIQRPLAVFYSATHLGSNVILTELKQGNKNFVVAVQTNRSQGRITVNSIRSIHPRTTSNIISWINDGLMGYAEKSSLRGWIEEKIKTKDYLNSSTPADVRKSLVSAAKVVNNFENPTLGEKKISFRVTPEQDKAYLDAVNREDMETAQRMVDEVLDKAGYTIRGEHGTTHKFTIFSNVNANVENSFGKGFYFTSDIEDAEKNYASDTGADLTNRIEILAERMEFEDGYEDMSYEERKEEATKRLNGGENLIISAAIRMENPCIFSIDPDGVYKETIFEAESVYDEETDEYSEPEGNLVDFVESLQEVLDSGEYWGANRFNAYELLDGESYTADKLKSKMDEMLDGVEDEEGNAASNEVFRAALEGMGFDGIIDNAPSHRFKGMGLSRETKHYIAFSPNQVKQADPVTYDNEGNVIPLSERANKENNDIRFRALPNERLRKLDEGETCNVERVFTQQKMFNFSSGEKIESYEDVAYIFRSLEDEAVENAFVALVKNGKPTIVHLGMGTATQTTVDQQAVIVAIERINPDAVYFVHNHPSGNLKASRQDALLLDSMKKAYGDIVKDGIIINLRSGKYSVFNEEGIKIEEASPNTPEKEIPAKTYSFSKRVFDKDFDVEELMNVTGSDVADAYAREHGLVAALTSSQRLGERGKLSLLVISQGNKIVGNVFLNHTEVLPSNLGNISKEIAYYVSAMGGQAGILYGRFGINETRHLGGAVNRASAGSVRMLDAISMTEFGGYVSALDEGVMEETPSYGKGETRFRVTDDIEEVNARFNEELEKLNEENADRIILSLGRPSDILISAGVEDKPMKLYGNKVIKKMKKHGFSISELRNLPEAVADPIAVFDNLGREGNRSVLTELKTANGNFLVSLDLGKGEEIDFNIVSSVFGKGEDNIVDWIERGLSTYINKEKALNYLHHSALHAVALRSSRLDSAAKVIKDFQNPSVGGGIRFRSVDKLRDRYDKMVRFPNKIGSVKWYENLPYRLREAYQDSMLSLKVLQEVILEETGNTMTSGENAYMAENQMSSKNKAEAEIYERDFFKPMMEEVKNLLAAGATYDEVQKYLFAKHGLERNMEMYKKNKQEAIDKWIEERTEQLVKDGMTQADARTQAQQDIALYPSMSDSELDKQYRRDYSGLTALTEKDNVADAEAEATKMVSDFEGRFDTAGLWGKINAATRETLRKSYDSGMMDKATYEKILGMYHYYIPLRGWDADVAEKEYEYLSDRGMNLSPVLKKTEGRTSLADDPIATIGFMAEGAIVQGNRNLMKQRFMNFVLNNPTSLVSVSKQWYVEQADGTWKPDNPQIPADATGDQVAAIVEQHEQKMLSLGKKAKTKRAGLKLDLHATKQEEQEHMVRVKRGGKEYCLYINGSPRAAQALNGMTNPDASDSDLYKAASAVKNFMARMFTSQNPAFVVSNLSRDLIWAGTAVAVRENKDYAARYTKNVGKAFKNATLPRLLHKYQNGTLDMNVEEERLFMEFIKHGGETGFTQITSVEDYKKDIERFVKEVQSGKSIGKKAWDGFFDTVEFLNRSAEDTTRFMVYMTSRQMGRDVATSVSDAKEITVNFNKKGSGGLGASVMNFCYIFFNAAIQSLSGFGKMMAEHPKRTLAGLTAYASAGVIVPAMSIALQALTGDDDDESYWDLPEWIRRNNLVLYVPFTDSGFITIPLPHELRPFYAMGEIALSAMCGREDVEDGLRKVAMNFAEMLPLDFTGNGGNLAVNLTPTIAQPVAQIIANKDYTGKPIYKDYEWNKRDPEWTKTYKGTSPWIVEGTKWLNRLSGGDDVKSGGVDWNPALIEHVLESYTGGAGKTFNRTMKTFQMMWDEDMRQWRNVPVISSFYQSGDERIQGSDVNNRYYEAKDEFEDTKHLLSGYKKQKKEHKPGTADYVEYARKLDELMDSDEYKRYKVFKGRQKAIKKISDKLKETDDRNRIDSLNTRLMQLKEEMLEELEKADDSPKP